jgi:hypothetical protein
MRFWALKTLASLSHGDGFPFDAKSGTTGL